MEAQVMERHLDGCNKLVISQKRKGCLQDCLGCDARTEFKYYKDGESEKFAESIEDSTCCCRFWCAPHHEYKMVVREVGTEAEILSMYHPFRCAVACCKCCCYQEMSMSSGGRELGKIEEQCFYCIPRFTITDANGSPIYKLHQPTCCGGCCVNICAEGNPCCGRGCCKVPFHVFPASQEDTDGDVQYAGKILKRAKGFGAEIFTDADIFEVDFPNGATTDQKGLLIGSTIFLNSNFFERGSQGEG